MLHMGNLNVNIDDQLGIKFTNEIFARKGMKKGNITKSVEEAITLWLNEKKELNEK
mgnify:CR=1 FL=1